VLLGNVVVDTGVHTTERNLRADATQPRLVSGE
jgi:hypothetical protein